MLKWFVSILFVLFIGDIFSQNIGDIYRCGQQQASDSLHSINPALHKVIEQNELDIQNWVSNQQKKPQTQNVISIPVVFHVLYQTEEQNIPDTQLIQQLDALTRDFRRLNGDTIIIPFRFKSLSADTEIEFCMAVQTPDGQITNGITRKEVDIPNIGITDKYYQPSLGGTQIWDPRYYLNIWVCDINETILGYTYLPGEPKANYDGVVLNYRICGDGAPVKSPYDKGRTLVHEVGHWLNLLHPWGPQEGCQYDDNITDTPLQEKPNSGCPKEILISCDNGPDGDMYINYMDYTYDRCQMAFTYGQKDRMNATLNTSRKLLQNSLGCTFPDTTQPFVESVDIFPNPAMKVLTLRFNLSSAQNVEITIYDITGKIMYQNAQTVEIERTHIEIDDLPNGSYILKVSSNSMIQKFKFIKLE